MKFNFKSLINSINYGKIKKMRFIKDPLQQFSKKFLLISADTPRDKPVEFPENSCESNVAFAFAFYQRK